MRVQTCAGHDAVSVSRALGRGGRFECGHAYIRAADVPYQWRLMRLSTTSIGEMSRGRLTTPNPSPRIVTARGPAASGAAFFFQRLGAGRRRTPEDPVADLEVSKDAAPRRDLSDATLRFGSALGVRRRHAPICFGPK